MPLKMRRIDTHVLYACVENGEREVDTTYFSNRLVFAEYEQLVVITKSSMFTRDLNFFKKINTIDRDIAKIHCLYGKKD